ncbi:cell division protein FtsQ/DivIB [Orrella sp. 11846]|uniref:cell division protein FtsQ/DivIB n=1 Tax=Orrella sp. 11846 TaxID=3409913 RepID=UPI003B5B51D8
MWKEARLINALANILMVGVVLACLAVVVLWVARLPAFSITRIELEPTTDNALAQVSPEVVRSVMSGRLEGNFFTLDLEEARSVFESASWVRQAGVRRIWPDTLRVSIEEQVPLALWNENELINTWGEVFTANRAVIEDEDDLPKFFGPDGTESLVIQRYAELDQWLEKIGLKVRTLSLSGRYALQAGLSNGMTLEMGRDPGAEAPDPQVGVPGSIPFGERIQRFVAAWPQAEEQLKGRTITHVDLRYPNGFALSLAELPESINSKKKR